MFPPSSQNTVGVCNQITFISLYYISCTLVTLIKVVDTRIQVSGIFDVTVGFNFINFSFQIFLLFIPDFLLSSRLALFIYIYIYIYIKSALSYYIYI